MSQFPGFGPPLSTLLLQRAQATAGQEVRFHGKRRVNFTVELDQAGNVLRIVPHEKGYEVFGATEAKARSSGIFPLLITDNAGYVLGTEKEGSKAKNAAQKRQAYLKLLQEGVKAGLPGLDAIFKAAGELRPEQFPGADASSVLTFRVDGQNPHKSPEVQAFWIQTLSGGETEGTCSVTGQMMPLATNSAGVRGVRGGMMSLASQSTHQESMRPYGLRTLGMGKETLELADRALSELARGETTAYHLGAQGTFLHWLSEQAPDPWEILTAPDQAEVHERLSAGESASHADAVIHIALVRGSSKRLQVLMHATLPLSEAEAHAQQFRRRFSGEMWQAERALRLTSDPKEQVPPHLRLSLYEHALSGRPLPSAVMQRLVSQWRKKAALTRAQRELLALHFPEDAMNDPNLLPPPLAQAYFLGKYAATVHQLHMQVNPRVGQSAAERHLRLLTTMPDRGFVLMQRDIGNVLKGVKSRPGLHYRLQERLGLATAPLTLPLPERLDTQQQAALSLGYSQNLFSSFSKEPK